MATMGYCHDCGQWVGIRADWSCPNGHPAERVNGWYDDATGQAVDPHAPVSPAPSGTPAIAQTGGTRAAFLTDLMAALSTEHGYTAQWGADTDVAISSNPVDARWGTGHKRAEYSAALKVTEAEGTVYFWETVKERGHGTSFEAPEVEVPSTGGTQRPGMKREATIGPGSASWEWGHGTLRRLVEEVAARHGFMVKVVLTRHSAAW
jgi:hypothetical protein